MRQFNVPDIYCAVAAKHHNNAVVGEDITLNLVRSPITCHKLGVFQIDTPGEIPYPPPKKGAFSWRHREEAILTLGRVADHHVRWRPTTSVGQALMAIQHLGEMLFLSG
jgi:hypothetical protein